MAQEIFNNPTTGVDLQNKLNNNFSELYDKTLTDRAFSHTFIAEGAEQPIALVGGVAQKYQLPVSIRKIKNFGVQEIENQPGVYALHYTGTRSITCVLVASSSLFTSTQNVVVKLMMYKNGNMAAGALIERKISTGSDLGALALSSSFEAEPGDYFDVYVEADIATNLTFKDTNIVIAEV